MQTTSGGNGMRLFAILVGIGAATSAIAHPGRLAADGCHNDRKNGGRHATARREARHLRLIARSERWAATAISLIAQWRVPPALPRFAAAPRGTEGLQPEQGSEVRRVGKDCVTPRRARWAPEPNKKNNTTR